MNVVNKTTNYFKYRAKEKTLFMNSQGDDEGITKDRIQSLEHDIQTRWHAKLTAVETHLARTESIRWIALRSKIPHSQLPRMSAEQLELLPEFITLLQELHRVARQLEAGHKFTVSRARPLLLELHETLQIKAGGILPSPTSFHQNDED